MDVLRSAVVAIVLGALSLVLPNFGFVTPSTYFLPGGFRDEGSAIAQPLAAAAGPR